MGPPIVPAPRIILGIDPGLQAMGWGVIEVIGSGLKALGNGTITSSAKKTLGARLVELEQGLDEVMAAYSPDMAAVETAFVARDPAAALKLGQARAVALLVPARAGLEVAEYAPNQIKKTVVGAGHAGKQQIQTMVQVLMPRCELDSEHSADALAVAICHAHRGSSGSRLAEAVEAADGARGVSP